METSGVSLFVARDFRNPEIFATQCGQCGRPGW